MKSIAIFGAGGLGKEVLALIRALPEWSLIGFYDDQLEEGTFVNGLEVVGNLDSLIKSNDNIDLIIAIGNPLVKQVVVNKLKDVKKIQYPTLIHPSAIVMDVSSTTLGEGTILSAGSILTTSILLGKHVLVNVNATIGHDCVVGDFSSIMPGANLAGNVGIGQEVLVGSGANVMNGVSLGDRSKIGMGAVVLQDVDEGATAVGVPSKMLKHK